MIRIQLRQMTEVMALSAAMSMALAFGSPAAALQKQNVPVTLHMDKNSRPTQIYDGYTSYVTGLRVSEGDSFTVTRDKAGVDLKDVTLNYYLITFDGTTQKYLECTVDGLKEGTYYPAVRPETIAQGEETGEAYDTLERCYMVELSYEGESKEVYFNLVPEGDIGEYQNLLLGKWERDTRGWKYNYQGTYLTSWAQINEKWYLFGEDGYMKTGWQEHRGNWYYLDPNNGVMRTSCTIDGYEVDERGVRQ